MRHQFHHQHAEAQAGGQRAQEAARKPKSGPTAPGLPESPAAPL